MPPPVTCKRPGEARTSGTRSAHDLGDDVVHVALAGEDARVAEERGAVQNQRDLSLTDARELKGEGVSRCESKEVQREETLSLCSSVRSSSFTSSLSSCFNVSIVNSP